MITAIFQATLLDLFLSENNASRGAVVSRYPDSDSPMAGEHLPQLRPETVVQPRVQKRVTTRGTHSAPVTQQLDQQKITLVDQVYIDISKNVENAYRQPADPECGNHQRHEAKRLPLPRPLGFRLTLGTVTWHNAVAKLHGNAQIGNAEGGQRKDVGDEERAVRVG